MDKPTLEMSVSKFKGTASLIWLAWLDEFQDPAFFYETHASYSDPEKRRLSEIMDIDIELDKHERESDDWMRLQARLSKLLLHYAAYEALPLHIENYYPNEVWIKSGRKLALQLARANTYRLMGVLPSKVAVKNLDRKRAYYFEAVKNAAYVLKDFLLEACESNEKLGSKINLDYSDNYDLDFILDSKEPLDVFISTIKMPSDRDIFETAKSMIREEKYYVVKFADEVFEFAGLSSFKSMERSLAKGRKPL